ncbi:hypothetical protein [Microbacterium sp. GXF7504]
MSDTAALRAEIERLQAENDRLRGTRPPRRGRWRAWVSVVCLVLAGILVPLSVVGVWTRAQLVDEQRFVETFAPLADDPQVQQVVIDQVDAAVQAQVDIPALTDTLFDGIATLDLPPAALSALELLRAPAASGAQTLITNTVGELVRSDAFGAIWDQALVSSHRALVAAATGGEGDAVVISGDGEIGIQVGPIISSMKGVLTDRGFAMAGMIPQIDATIVVAQADALALVMPVYAAGAAAGYVLPWAALLLLVAGVLVARDRMLGATGAGIAILAGAVATLLALGIGGTVLQTQAPALGVPSAAAASLWSIITGRMSTTAVVLVLLGVTVALAGWVAGRSAPARRLRGVGGSLAASARRSLRARGLDTGAFGTWLTAQRTLVTVGVVVLAVLVLVFAPLTAGVVVSVVAGVLVLLLAAALLRKDAGDDAATAEVDAPPAAP